MRNPITYLWQKFKALIARLPWPGHMRRHPVWSTVIILVGALIGLMAFAITRPKQPEYVTDTVKRGDVVRTVEAVGTVISEKDLALQFPTSGIVADVRVKEGDIVKAGQQLAALRAGTLSADVASASASLQSAQADLNGLLEGTRPEDIAIAEAELLSKRAALNTAKTSLTTAERKLESSEEKLRSLKSEAKISLAGTVSAAGSTASEYLADARTGLKTINDVYDSIAVQDVVQKFSPSEYSDLKNHQNRVTIALDAAIPVVATAADYEEALSDLTIARIAVAGVADALRHANDFLLSLPITSNFTVSVRDTNSDLLATERGSIQAALSGVDAALNNLRDLSASLDTKIAAEESALTSSQGDADRAKSDIATYEASVTIAAAQLQLKKAGTRPQDIAAARDRVAENAARLQRARAAISDTVLTAPVDGMITKVNVKKGEILPTGPAITMLGTTPYRIEIYVAEVDIPLIMVSQSGSIELDAFPGIDDALRVSEIDEAATDRDGVPKYRVKLDFALPRDELRVGMTGDSEIITGKRVNVLSVPRRAVVENENGEEMVRVLVNGEVSEKPVTMGMEGSDGEVEVDGVEEGDVVVVLIKE